MSRSRTIVVIGGGLAGLAAATYLARAGQRVMLLETGKSLGGRGRTERVDGFALNLGAHALYRGGPAERVLGELDVGFTGRPPKLHAAKVLIGDALFPLPVGVSSMLSASYLGARGRYELGRFLAAAAPKSLASLAEKSADDWLDDAFTHPIARSLGEVFVRLSAYVGPTELLSADAAAMQLAAAQRGVLYLDGGWQTLVDGLAARARAAGTDLRLSTAAREILHDGSQVTGVRTATGEVIEAAAIVCALPLSTLAELLPADAESESIAERATPARAACLELGIERATLATTNLILGADVPLYASLHSAAAKLAPEGAALVHTAKYLGVNQPAGHADDRRAMRALGQLMVPDSSIALERFRPSLVVHQDVPTKGRGGLAGRAAVRHGSLVGLYRAGDSVGHEGLLLDSALSSARRAAELCVRELDAAPSVAYGASSTVDSEAVSRDGGRAA